MKNSNSDTRRDKAIGLPMARALSVIIFFFSGYFVRSILGKRFLLINQSEVAVWAIALPVMAILVVVYAALLRREGAKTIIAANQRYEDLINNIQGGVITCVYDKKTQGSKATYINSGWTELTGYTMEELDEVFNGNPQALVFEKDRELAHTEYMEQTARGKNYNLEYRLKRKDGSIIWTIDRGILTVDDQGRGQNLSIITEVTEIKEKEKELLRMSRTDPLTGLNNKTATISRCQNVLDKQKSGLHALLVLDIDDFKGINDSLGHIFGDTVLIEVSARLKKLFRNSDIIGRVGGDEFIVFMADICSKQAAEEKAKEICSVFCNTYMGDTNSYKISCSVGVAYSESTDAYQSMFHKADIALYKAKNMGKNQAVSYGDGDKTMERTSKLKPAERVEVQEKDSGQLELKERVFELLYSSVDFVGSIKMALAFIGRILDVDKIYIFENSQDNRTAHNTYEWCAEGIVSRGKSQMSVPVADIKLFEQYDENGILSCGDINALPADIMRFAEMQRVQAFTQIAIVENGKICGFISFDRLTKKTLPTKEELELMVFAAKVIGVFILKKRAEDGVILYNKNKMAALDAMPNRIYVIDKNFKLQYMNDMTRATAPQARGGDRCYDVFMGNTSPCENCPAIKCDKGSASSEIYNQKFDLHIISNASKIAWEGEDNMVLLCCQDITASKSNR